MRKKNFKAGYISDSTAKIIDDYYRVWLWEKTKTITTYKIDFTKMTLDKSVLVSMF